MASMTKDELKRALLSHGIDLPNSSARKDELIALYDEHVLPLEKSKTEFSSDDELELAPDDGGKKILADVFHLSDDQLLEALVEVGLEVGPIVDSTRTFYQKRLSAALLSERGVDEQALSKDSTGFSVGEKVEGSNHKRISAKAEVNGTSDEADFNGFGDASKADFSADDDDEPQPSVEAKNVTTKPVQSPAADSSSPRRRLGDSVAGDRDAEGRRFTPTPRRSIHSYKLTETSHTSTTKNKDGTTIKDHDYKRVTTTGSNQVVHQSSNRNRLYSFVRLLPRFFLLLIVAALTYYVYAKGKK